MTVLIGKEFLDTQRNELSISLNDEVRVLIVEDSEADSELEITALINNGLKIYARRAETFEAFIKELEDFRPSIILSDYSLPSFNGREALIYLRKNHYNIPFILVTGAQSEEVAVQCLKDGADDYILKTNLIRLPSAFRNAIEKKRMEQEKTLTEARLLQYQELYENLLQAQSQLATGFLIAEGNTLQILYVNDAFCSMCDYNADEILSLSSLYNLLIYESVPNFKEQLKKITSNDNSSVTFVSGIIRKDDQFVNLEFTIKQLVKNDNAKLVMIVHDVTDRIKNEIIQRLDQEALRESEKRFRSLIEDVKDYAIFMLDPAGKIISWNSGAQKILGYSEEEILLKNFNILFPETGSKKSSASLLDQAKKDGRVEQELRLLKKGKHRFWAFLTITVLYFPNSEVQHYSIIIRDLTKSKLAEDQLREHEIQLRALAAHLQETREEERTRIARELHDEFSQMLTALRMDLTILGRMISKTVSEPLSRISLLEKITSISELLETTIRATRRIITELRPAVLDELGLQTAIQWQAQEFENRTSIRCKILRLQRDIVLDQEKSTAIFRIFQEALTNAAKHASATMVNVSLRIEDKNLILEIVDNGKGFEENKMKDPTSAGILGIRERALAIGGYFNFKSDKGRGTKLTFIIPYEK